MRTTDVKPGMLLKAPEPSDYPLWIKKYCRILVSERLKRSAQRISASCAKKSAIAASRSIIPQCALRQSRLPRLRSGLKQLAEEGVEFESFSVHDLRRTASTLLHEAGYNSDWNEKCLAHEQRGVRAVYNKAEYAAQRTSMLQDWADIRRQ